MKTATRRQRNADLTVLKIANAKPFPDGRPKKFYGGRGLFLLVVASDKKFWRFKYAYSGREKSISLGAFPEVSLADAHTARDDARKLLRSGIDPSAARKAARPTVAPADGPAPNAFRAVAERWLAKQSPAWAPRHTATVAARLTTHVYPFIGDRPIAAVTRSDIAAILDRIEARGTIPMAYRVHNIIGQVLRHAMALDFVASDASAGLTKTLTRRTTRHHASITDPEGIGGLMRAINGYQGSLVVRVALRLHALTFVRSWELRGARWSEVDWERNEWRIPADRMKKRTQHIVPLSRQAVAILQELRKVTGSGPFIFPSGRSATRPLSGNAIGAALDSMGYDGRMTAHGFRSLASTRLHEMRRFVSDAIERQLAHAEPNAVKSAYDYADYLDERKIMMQSFADLLDQYAADVGPNDLALLRSAPAL